MAGVWQTQRYYADLEELLGGPVPLNEAGQQRWEEIQTGRESGEITDDARYVCVPDGLPRILSSPYGAKPAQRLDGLESSPGQTLRLLLVLKPSNWVFYGTGNSSERRNYWELKFEIVNLIRERGVRIAQASRDVH